MKTCKICNIEVKYAYSSYDQDDKIVTACRECHDAWEKQNTEKWKLRDPVRLNYPKLDENKIVPKKILAYYDGVMAALIEYEGKEYVASSSVTCVKPYPEPEFASEREEDQWTDYGWDIFTYAVWDGDKIIGWYDKYTNREGFPK